MKVSRREEGRPPAEQAAHELAQVQRQIEHARAELRRLRIDLTKAQAHLGTLQPGPHLDVDERLVLSALRAREDADTATQALRAATRAAQLDDLTRLPNRVLLRDRLAQAVAAAKRRRSRVAVLFVDLNGFKRFNDTLGHAAGDQVLRLAAARLASAVRAADTVSRHGGDEFVILLTDVGDAGHAVAAADKLGAALAAPGRVANQVVRLTASMGISLYPDDGDEADTLIDHADAAMYRAKRLGRRSAVFRWYDRVRPGAGPHPLPAPAAGAADASDAAPAAADAGARGPGLPPPAATASATADADTPLDRAQRALVRQNEVLALVAHELRNPLTPLRTAAALLAGAHGDEPLLRLVQSVIERQVAHMTRLVGDLLDVSRADTGKLRLQRQTIELAGVVDDVVRCCAPTMEARRHRFTVQVASPPPRVEADPVRLTQILCNLLDNACRYTPVGGDIDLSVTAADGEVTLRVRDNGIGITPEALPRVFDAFVQDGQAVGFDRTGLGIGLTVVRELVEAHGGRVVVRSAGRGLGSEFVVTLPSQPR